MEPQNKCLDNTSACRLVTLRQRDPNSRLGFSLRGGKEATGSSVGVFVSHIEPMGQASQIGLRVGDQLIQVNGLQVSQATYDEVIELIKRTPKCDQIRLLVNYVGRIPFQEKPGEPIGWLLVDYGETLDQQLELEPADQRREQEFALESAGHGRRELNLNLNLDKSSKSVNQVEDSTDADDDRRQQSPIISTINNNSGSNNDNNNGDQEEEESAFVDHGYGVGMMADEQNSKLSLLSKTSYMQDTDSAASNKSLTFTSSASSCVSPTKDDDDEEDVAIDATQVGVGGLQLSGCCQGSSSSAASTSSGCSISMRSVQSGHSGSSMGPMIADYETADTHVRVPGGQRTSEPFGCGVVKGPDEWPGIFVQNVKRDSLAGRVGLEPGDQLIRAEHHELSEMSFEEAISTIKQLQQQQDELLLIVRKGAALKHLAKCKQHHMETTTSAKANNKMNAKTNNEDLRLKRVSQNEVECRQAKCQPQLARRKPLEPPPAPPTRRNQQACDEQTHGGDSLKLKHNDKRLADGLGSGVGRPANSISRQPATATPEKPARRQAYAQQLGATGAAVDLYGGPLGDKKKQAHYTAELGTDEQHELEQPKTISELIARMPPTDRAAQQQSRPARRPSDEVVETNLQTLQRTDSPERVRLTDTPGAAAIHLEHSSGPTNPALAAQRRRQLQQQQQRRQLQNQPRMAQPMDQIQAKQPTPDYEPPTREENQSISECCRLVFSSSGRAKIGDDDESTSLSLNQDANQQHPRSAMNRNHDQDRDSKTGKTTARKVHSSMITGKSCNSKTIRDYVSDDEDRVQDRDLNREQEEQIRIVKQNCKLHHNSMQSLVRSKMFLQQQLLINDCLHRHHHHPQHKRSANVGSGFSHIDLSPHSSHRAAPIIGEPKQASHKTRLVPSTKSYKAPQVPHAPLQRYVSVDNLNLLNVHNYRVCNELTGNIDGRFKRMTQQIGVDSPEITSQQSVALYASQRALHSRSNSVLGQALSGTVAAPNANMRRLACCPISHQHSDDDQLLLLRRQQQQQHILTAPSSQADLMNCCLTLACLNSSQPRAEHLKALQQQQQLQHYHALPIGTGLIRPTTMKHLRAASSSISAKTATGSASKVFKQQCSNTLALARFKARSEDKLNMMNINLNYVKIGGGGGSSQQQMASRHLLRLQQARHQQQARIMAANSAGKQRHNEWRRQIATTELMPVPTCCQQQQKHQKAAYIREESGELSRLQPTTTTSVFNYATATGIISQTRKVSSLARSCCAIDRFQTDTSDDCQGLPETATDELFDMMIQKQKQQHQRRMKSLDTTGACYTYSCCCPAYLQPQSAPIRTGQRSTIASSQSAAKCKHLVNRETACASGGASTDSSGYQSASEAVRRRNLALEDNLEDGHHKIQPTGACCQPGPPPRPSRSNGVPSTPLRNNCQTKRLSTFSPNPLVGLRQPAATGGEPAAIEISTTSGSCGVSSLSSTAASSPSSLSPSSCSPLSSPGRRYLSSASPASSAADLQPATPFRADVAQTDGNEPNGNRTRLFNRRAGAAAGAGQTKDGPNGVSIPRPPPMPIDDRTLSASSRSDDVLPARTGVRQQQQKQQTAVRSRAETLAHANKLISGPDSNKLCFVDELKMLASQQQRQGSSTSTHFGAGTDGSLLEPAAHGQLGDSSTLIKLINANKAATSGVRRPNEGRNNECNCCQASDCSLSAGKLDEQRNDSSCKKFGCNGKSGGGGGTLKVGAACPTHLTKASCEQPSKSVQLRDEEHNKRRQHELLMEEFKTAHSKMFNRLRQASNSERYQQQHRTPEKQAHDDDEGTDRSVEAKPSKIRDGNTKLAKIHPRPTVATN